MRPAHATRLHLWPGARGAPRPLAATPSSSRLRAAAPRLIRPLPFAAALGSGKARWWLPPPRCIVIVMTPIHRAVGAFGLLLGLVGVASAPAQITIPLADITRAYPTLDPVVLTLNGTAKVARPTPLLITGATLALNGSWFCLDPLQTIYFTPTNEPAGNALTYAGTAPSGFNLWGAAAPGLTTGRIQKLADLFRAYAPSGIAATPLVAGALQLAIWEIANEPGGNPLSLTGAGYLGVSPYGGSTGATDMIVLANSMLASLGTAAVKNLGTTASLDFLIDGTYRRIGTTDIVLVQDLVSFTPVLPIPEPGTYAGAALLSLVAIVWHRRSRFRPVAASVPNHDRPAD